jgi:hypothetical protein
MPQPRSGGISVAHGVSRGSQREKQKRAAERRHICSPRRKPWVATRETSEPRSGGISVAHGVSRGSQREKQKRAAERRHICSPRRKPWVATRETKASRRAAAAPALTVIFSNPGTLGIWRSLEITPDYRLAVAALRLPIWFRCKTHGSRRGLQICRRSAASPFCRSNPVGGRNPVGAAYPPS